jgi:type VI secretion system protein ImpF
MAGPASERTVLLSVVDRLIDRRPGLTADPPMTWEESVRELKASLLRDIEWLLNTRRIAEPAADLMTEVQRSVYHFGIPDVSSLSADSSLSTQKLLQHVEETIRVFEPRLTRVRVLPAEQSGKERREIRFVVDALLRMDPNPERVIFDTVLETARGEFRVSGSADAR